MGKLLYQFIIISYRLIAHLWSLFNHKAKLLVEGRKNWRKELRLRLPASKGKTVWIHCASLGEFEQGRPVMEVLKKENPGIFILLTFFSPSGYEAAIDYKFADLVCYLPWDSEKNAITFYRMVKPDLICFVKYEFWYHFLRQGKEAHIPVILISGIFRHDQLFFKSYGAFYRKMLQYFNHFFVQNTGSQELLTTYGFSNVTVAGDTRMDRVIEIAGQAETIEVLEKFKGESRLLIAGSAWPDDLEVLLPLINDSSVELKYIIAPHEINSNQIETFRQKLNVLSLLYSELKDLPEISPEKEANVLIIDNIGMLSAMYRYGDFAFIGGAYGDGLHNILEAAVYGMPVFFGHKHYRKFQEALDLIERKGAFPVSNAEELKSKLSELLNDAEAYRFTSNITRAYVYENRGATRKILDYILQTIT
ncbi:MAG: 3-deoxy-D-manno-octulosonic acid transferase [Bacteroidetes bacterium]|nr:3-deoxy-D-manno-octulosonic acid transferase [Bacteroidota bacterium]